MGALAALPLLLLGWLAPAGAFLVSPATRPVVQRPGAVASAPTPPMTVIDRSDAPCRASAITMKEKKDVLELEGTVVEALKGANFRVQIDDILVGLQPF